MVYTMDTKWHRLYEKDDDDMCIFEKLYDLYICCLLKKGKREHFYKKKALKPTVNNTMWLRVWKLDALIKEH